MRTWQGWALGAFLMVAGGGARAEAPADSIVRQLREQGYVEFSVDRTWLGRIQVIALAPDGTRREIVVSPGTGEILRDYVEASDGGSSTPRILNRPAGGSDSDVRADSASGDNPGTDPSNGSGQGQGNGGGQGNGDPQGSGNQGNGGDNGSGQGQGNAGGNGNGRGNGSGDPQSSGNQGNGNGQGQGNGGGGGQGNGSPQDGGNRGNGQGGGQGPR